MSESTLAEDEQELQHLVAELQEHYHRSVPVDNVVQFCVNFFYNKLQQQQQQLDSDTESTLSSLPPMSTYNLQDRRVSVSAESMTPRNNNNHGSRAYITSKKPKTREQCERIRASVADHFLFRDLDEEQYRDVIDAMVEKRANKDEHVIEQGAVGDYFYIVEQGHLDCYIQGRKITHYGAGGSFGELALMYNAPRAATIVATTHDTVLWALDRITFRTILMENTSRRRRLYESFLRDMPLLRSLEPYERHKIADALESVSFQDGDKVLVQGDVGDRFYMIEEGEALVYQDNKKINRLGRAAYFGGKQNIHSSMFISHYVVYRVGVVE